MLLVDGYDEVVASGLLVKFEVTRVVAILPDIRVIGKDQDAKRLHPLVRATRKIQDLLEDPVVAGTIPRMVIVIHFEVAGVRHGVMVVGI